MSGCPRCGKRITKRAKFCSECGFILPQTVQPVTSSSHNIKGANRKVVIVILVITIILVILLVLSLLGVFTPAWQKYEITESDNLIVYRNEELDARIEVNLGDSDEPFWIYEAHWVNPNGYQCFEGQNSLESLLDNIYSRSGEFSEGQIKWYEFMCNDVI